MSGVHDDWAELTAPPKTDPYALHTEGPVRAAPVARNRQVLGYLWAGVDDCAAGFVPRLETGEAGAVAARKWANMLQESSAGGLRPLQALAHWTTPGAVRGLRFGSIRDLPGLAVLHELAGQPVVPTGPMPVVRTSSNVGAAELATVTAPHMVPTAAPPATTDPWPTQPPVGTPVTTPPAQGTVMRYDRPVVTGQTAQPGVLTGGTETVPVPVRPTVPIGRAARHQYPAPNTASHDARDERPFVDPAAVATPLTVGRAARHQYPAPNTASHDARDERSLVDPAAVATPLTIGRAARHQYPAPDTRRQRFLDVPAAGGAQRVSTVDPSVWEHQRDHELAARLAELDHVLQARPIPEDVIVWRVLRAEELPRVPDRPEGLILESSGYQVVHLVAPEPGPDEFARVRMRVPRGVPGLHLNSLRWDLPTPQLLLARGLRTYVHGGMQTAYGWSLVGEVVWQAEQHGLQAV